MEYETPTGRINKGVTTTWLKEKHPSDPPCLVPIFVRKSQFRLPSRTSTPVIMIGPGTGIAPFRGFIQERDVAKKEGTQYTYSLRMLSPKTFNCFENCFSYINYIVYFWFNV